MVVVLFGLASALASLFLFPTHANGADTELSKFQCLQRVVVEKLSDDARAEGFDASTLENVLLVAIKSKLPRLKVGDSPCTDWLYLNLNVRRNGNRGYFGSIRLGVH